MDLIKLVELTTPVLLGGFGLAAFKFWLQESKARRELEHRIRFSALHSRRIRVIERVYRRLATVERAFDWARDYAPAPDESLRRLDRCIRVSNSFRAHFEQNRIWFEPETSALVDELWGAQKESGYALQDFLHHRVNPQGATDEPSSERVVDLRRKSDAILLDRVRPLKLRVEDEFRKLLGVVGMRGSEHSSRVHFWSGSTSAQPPVH